MKKTAIFLICSLLLSSCSLTLEQLFFLPVPTPTPMPTLTSVPTDAPTFTPTTPTLTFTVTPTLVGETDDTSTPEPSTTPLFETPFLLITPNTPTPGIDMDGFLAINLSGKEFYKGDVCQPTSVRIIAQAEDPLSTFYIALFVRFKSKHTDANSDWTRILIPSKDYSGTFTHDLTPNEMKNVDFYRNAWVQYQFVAYNSQHTELGRTGIFSERLELLDCIPTPTPTLSPTPTVLKP